MTPGTALCDHFFPEAGRTAIIGIGNTERGDDGVGVYIAHMLADEFPNQVWYEGVRLADHFVMTLIQDGRFENVLLIDAADFSAVPGTCMLIDEAELNNIHSVMSTHQTPMTLLFELLSDAGITPRLLAIQPLDLSFAVHLSAPVEMAATQLIQQLRIILARDTKI